MDATEIDNNTTTVFAKQTNDIFVLLNDKVVVFTNGGSMYEMLSRAEYITFGDNSWSDGNKTKDIPETNYKDHRIKFFKKASWTISSDLDLDGMKAKVENGLMTITIPVAAKAKPNEYSIE